ncbi:MAG TPA: tyrosine--tRNA ligase [Planctomycetaceae bacterium]|nr:tyrosine--tRNA ligase [Planctomycetaceae bacterium]
MAFAPVEEQLAVIRRGVEKIVPEEELASKLKQSRESGRPLRIKYGIDPTGIDVHLGHTVPLRKLRQFQELGHQPVIIIGNYTALVGDPSGRDQARARLTREQVEANAIDYLNQVGKVVDMAGAEVVRNGDWFGTMNFADILELCSKVTVAQLLTRDDFSKRYRDEQPIFLHECLYPVMQAWDSVKVRSDIELGGTEQLYSFMLARDLQRDQSLPQQIGVMSPILVGIDGVRRMGKSLGNYIGISEAPYEMMKKFMQVPDQCMWMYFELLTAVPLDEVERLIASDPKQAKITLARHVIGEYHSAAEADEAAAKWQREISDKALPTDLEQVEIPRTVARNPHRLVDLIHNVLKLTPSSSDARRLISQGGVWINERDQRVTDINGMVELLDGMIVGAGKKRIVQVKLTEVD